MGGRVRRWLNSVLIHLHNYTADRYSQGWGDIVLLLGEKWVWGLVWNSEGGGLTYESFVRVVLPVIATAIAFAPTSPIWL